MEAVDVDSKQHVFVPINISVHQAALTGSTPQAAGATTAAADATTLTEEEEGVLKLSTRQNRQHRLQLFPVEVTTPPGQLAAATAVRQGARRSLNVTGGGGLIPPRFDSSNPQAAASTPTLNPAPQAPGQCVSPMLMSGGTTPQAFGMPGSAQPSPSCNTSNSNNGDHQHSLASFSRTAPCLLPEKHQVWFAWVQGDGGMLQCPKLHVTQLCMHPLY